MKEQITLTRGISIIVVLAVVVIAVLSSRHVTAPIQDLTDAAKAVAQGKFQTRAQVRGSDEISELGQVFNEMVPQLQDRLRIKQSLDVAMEVQQSLLPAGPPSVPGLDIAGKSIYCDETGGDYYDFLDLSALGGHHLGLAVGDVTGHGIAAALLMATARALLRSEADRQGNLAELMTAINTHLCIESLHGRFMTLFYAVIDARQRTLRWSSAGHDPVLCYDPAVDSFLEFEEGEDIPLGIDSNWPYTECGPVQLESGRILVIGTDGIWEARNPEDQMFGKESLRNVIRTHAQQSAEHISQAITEAIADFRGTWPQEDDITLVVVKVG